MNRLQQAEQNALAWEVNSHRDLAPRLRYTCVGTESAARGSMFPTGGFDKVSGCTATERSSAVKTQACTWRAWEVRAKNRKRQPGTQRNLEDVSLGDSVGTTAITNKEGQAEG